MGYLAPFPLPLVRLGWASSVLLMLLRDGILVKCEVYGEVQVNCHLSGIPDLTLSFANPGILNDVGFHPCVRFRPWESHQILSFVPADGQFKLMSYRCAEGSLQVPSTLTRSGFFISQCISFNTPYYLLAELKSSRALQYMWNHSSLQMLVHVGLVCWLEHGMTLASQLIL